MPIKELKHVNVSFSQENENIHYWETDTSQLSIDNLLEAASSSGILNDCIPLDIIIFDDNDGAVLFHGSIIAHDTKYLLLSEFSAIPSLDDNCLNIRFKETEHAHRGSGIVFYCAEVEGLTVTPPSTKLNARQSLINQIKSGELDEFAKGLHSVFFNHDDPEAKKMAALLENLLRKYDKLFLNKKITEEYYQRTLSFDVEITYTLDDDDAENSSENRHRLMSVSDDSLQQRLSQAINNERINGVLTDGLDVSADLVDITITSDIFSSFTPDH